MAAHEWRLAVFVNCPFDEGFRPMLDAIVFAVRFCGYTVRSALEAQDSGELRLTKITRLLAASRFSLHDISRVELDKSSGLPRFNMPIELGIALGMKHLGRPNVRDHRLLVLDTERYRYQQFASDLAGVDISAHGGAPARVITAVRDFLASAHVRHLPGGDAIAEAHASFTTALPALAAIERQSVAALTFAERLRHIDVFLGTSA